MQSARWAGCSECLETTSGRRLGTVRSIGSTALLHPRIRWYSISDVRTFAIFPGPEQYGGSTRRVRLSEVRSRKEYSPLSPRYRSCGSPSALLLPSGLPQQSGSHTSAPLSVQIDHFRNSFTASGTFRDGKARSLSW